MTQAMTTRARVRLHIRAASMGQAMQMAMPKVEANVKRAEALPFENEPPFDESLVLLDWCKFILVLILYHVIMSPAL